jgi:hypothetical protein
VNQIELYAELDRRQARIQELEAGARAVLEWRDLIKQDYPDMAGLLRGMDALRAALKGEEART